MRLPTCSPSSPLSPRLTSLCHVKARCCEEPRLSCADSSSNSAIATPSCRLPSAPPRWQQTLADDTIESWAQELRPRQLSYAQMSKGKLQVLFAVTLGPTERRSPRQLRPCVQNCRVARHRSVAGIIWRGRVHHQLAPQEVSSAHQPRKGNLAWFDPWKKSCQKGQSTVF